MLREKFSRVLKRHHVTRHMVKVYISSFSIMFSVGFTITMVFPYLPFMVKFLLPDIEDRNVGRYAGFLASSMYFGRFCGSYFWGWLADRHSKKTILMYSGLCMAFSSFFFGFSVNFYMAIFFRYLTGLTNGIVGNTKAMLCEHSDNVNQGLGMSIVTCAWGASIVFGPGVSGVIADPVGQYDIPSNSFLERFPYCLPSMFSALLSVTGVIIVGCLLPPKPEDKHDDNDVTINDDAVSDVAINDVTANDVTINVVAVNDATDIDATRNLAVEDDNITNDDIPQQDQSSHDLEAGSRDCNHVLDVHTDSSKQSSKQKHSVNGFSYRRLLEQEEMEDNKLSTIVMEDLTVETSDVIVQHKIGKLSYFILKLKLVKDHAISTFLILLSLLKDKVTCGTVFLYGLFSFAVIGFDECYSLWASTSKSLGGLGFSLHNIGTSLGVVGIMMIPMSLLAFNPIHRKFGALMTHHINTALLIALLPLFPSLTYLSGNPAMLWIFLLTILLIVRVAIANCFICQALFINNSVTPDKLGAVNGLGLSVTSLFRTFSPVVFGALYSLSLSDAAQHIGFPVDFHLIFFLFSFGFLLTMILTALFPKRLNKQRK